MIFLLSKEKEAIGHTTEVSDAQLIERFQKATDSRQRQRILEAIYDRYSSLTLKVAYNQVNDYEQLKDIHRGVWNKIHEHIDKIKNGAALRDWIIIITREYCTDFKTNKGLIKETGLSGEVIAPSAEGETIQTLNMEGVPAALRDCVKRLDPSDQTIFRLKCQGYPDATIREALNLSEEEMRSAYDQINHNLVQCMQTKGYNIDANEIFYSGGQNG